MLLVTQPVKSNTKSFRATAIHDGKEKPRYGSTPLQKKTKGTPGVGGVEPNKSPSELLEDTSAPIPTDLTDLINAHSEKHAKNTEEEPQCSYGYQKAVSNYGSDRRSHFTPPRRPSISSNKSPTQPNPLDSKNSTVSDDSRENRNPSQSSSSGSDVGSQGSSTPSKNPTAKCNYIGTGPRDFYSGNSYLSKAGKPKYLSHIGRI